MPEQPIQVGKITIGINDIKFINYESTTRVQELKEPLINTAFEFQIEMKTDIMNVDKLFNINTSVTLYEKQGETKIELARLQTFNSFRIINFDDVIIKKDDQLLIPDHLLAVASGIAVSTARGMFVMCVKNTVISNALIPIIDSTVFVPKKNV